jgi:putrescine importer
MLTPSGSDGRANPPDEGRPIQFRKSLRIQDLILFGVICVTPTAPIPWFGILQKLSHGQAATTVALAMLAMLPTAFSYGRMAARFPVAGSAYTYVTRGLHPHLGFLAGWATLLDYFLIPITGVIYCAVTMHRVSPAIPYLIWAAFFAALSTVLNLRGIRTGVRANQLLLVVMTVVIVAVIGLAVHYVWVGQGPARLISLAPFYQPATFDLPTIATATSLAALTYIGFDAVTTLAEEVENPERNMSRATVWVCLVTGAVSVLLVYLGQLVWPAYQPFRDVDTAFLDVAQRIGGGGLFTAMVVVLILATFGAALTGQAGAARVLFGMGRSGAFPPRLFAHLNSMTLQPNYNVWLVGLVALMGAAALNFERAGELLNFGAFLAFMGVNLAALRASLNEWRAGVTRQIVPALVSLLGFSSCLSVWLSLPAPARHVGFAWMALGVIYQLIRTRGYRTTLGFALDGTTNG